MDLPVVKHHIQELYNLLAEEPNNATFFQLCADLGAILNSSQLKEIQQATFVPVVVLQAERKRRQAVENLIKRLGKNPAYPDEVKSDIAKSLRETVEEYREQIKNLRQTQQQETA